MWAGQRSRLELLSDQQHTSATGGTADFALQPNTVQVVIGITPATFKETKTSGSGLCCFCVVDAVSLLLLYNEVWPWWSGVLVTL